MRTTIIIVPAAVAAAVVLSLVPTAAAQITAIKESDNFNFKYEMNVAPEFDDQGGAAGADWVLNNAGTAVRSVSGGVLTMITEPGADPTSFHYTNDDTGALLDFATGYTVEMKVRVVSSANVHATSIVAFPGSPNNDQMGWAMIDAGGQGWGNNGGDGSDIPLGNDDNTDDFHVIRFAQEPNTGTFSFWRDEVLLDQALPGDDFLVTIAPVPFATMERIGFGDQGGSWSGEVQIDYFRFDTTGAFCPVECPTPATTFTWVTDELGKWTDRNNWTPAGGPPNSPEQTAVFGSDPAITGPTIVAVTSPVTVNRIEFNNGAHSYTIAGFEGVTLTQNTTTSEIPRIDVFAGDHQFQAEVTISNDTTVEVVDASSLTFNNALNLGGRTLLKTGEGTISINNVLNSGGGTVECLQGTCSGSGRIGGNLDNSGGTVSPGNSPGVMEVAGDFTQHEDGTLLIELAGTASGTEHDLLSVGGTAHLEGRLEVSLLEGFRPEDGDSFDILNFRVLSGEFDDISLPKLAAGLVWDTSSLHGDGSLAVVPEPSPLLLLAMASVVLILPRGRNDRASR